MNDYCRNIILNECAEELNKLFIELVKDDSHLTMKNFLENLENSNFLKHEIREKLKLYFD